MRRRGIYPLTRLAIALGSAARNIEDELSRDAAARDAALIPKCRAEIGGGRRGEMARAGRALLAKLPAVPQEEWVEAAKLLRGYADAIVSKFEVTSEISLGSRRRA